MDGPDNGEITRNDNRRERQIGRQRLPERNWREIKKLPHARGLAILRAEPLDKAGAFILAHMEAQLTAPPHDIFG